MAKLKTTREMIDEARGAGAEADTLEVGMDAAKLSEPKPLTAEEQAEMAEEAEWQLSWGADPWDIKQYCRNMLRWYATVQALRRRAEGAERNRDMYRGFLERQRARVAELVAERDAWREEHDMWRDGFMATKARADMWRDGWDAEGGDDE